MHTFHMFLSKNAIMIDIAPAKTMRPMTITIAMAVATAMVWAVQMIKNIPMNSVMGIH